MNWRNKKVLITGAGGFIGSHLTERLVEKGANVKAFVHYNALGRWGWLDDSPAKTEVEVIAGDITDMEFVNNAVKGNDVVFHLAALIAIPYSYIAPSSYVKANIDGTLNVMMAAREHGIERVVHTSTSETYGTAQYVPIDEKHPLQGQSPYSATKIGADKIVESFHLSFNIPVSTVRPFNTYGPRQSARAVIPTIITQCLSGKEVKLGNLLSTRDMNYVLNTVDGFIKIAETKKTIGRTVNLGSGEEISIGKLAELIAKLCGQSIEIVCDEQRMRPKTSEVDRLMADISLASELTGWTPEIPLTKGLELTIEWMQKHLERYRPGVYII